MMPNIAPETPIDFELERTAPNQFRLRYSDGSTIENLTESEVKSNITQSQGVAKVQEVFHALMQKDLRKKLAGLKLVQLGANRYAYIDKKTKTARLLSKTEMQVAIQKQLCMNAKASAQLVGKLAPIATPLFEAPLEQLSQAALAQHSGLKAKEVALLTAAIARAKVPAISSLGIEETFGGKFRLIAPNKNLTEALAPEGIIAHLKKQYGLSTESATAVFKRLKTNFYSKTAEQRANMLLGAKMIQLNVEDYLIINPRWSPPTQVMTGEAIFKNLQERTGGEGAKTWLLAQRMLLKAPRKNLGDRLSVAPNQSGYVLTDARGNRSKVLPKAEMLSLVSRRYGVDETQASLLCAQLINPQPNRAAIDALRQEEERVIPAIVAPEDARGTVRLPETLGFKDAKGKALGPVSFKEAMHYINISELEKGRVLSNKQLIAATKAAQKAGQKKKQEQRR